MVTGMRNSISGVGSRSAPVTASASVIEWPTVNARHHPEAVPPVAAPVDGGQREQEQNVIHRLQIGDVAEAQMDEGEKLGHGGSATAGLPVRE